MGRNLTSGSVVKNIISFSLPYLLSYFLQTLYGMADLFIIGIYGSVADLTAVTVGSQAMHMLTVMIVGLSMGTTVMIGRCIGAGRHEEAGDFVGGSVILFSVMAVVATVTLLFAVRPIVALLSTPTDAVEGTVAYLTICFAGIPFITAYNVISSIFRGLGDSKSPMYFIAIACVVNILLDFLFMGVCKMGPSGAALGTTLSQGLSAMIALWVMKRGRLQIRVGRENLCFRRTIMGRLLRIGIPIALQDGLIQVSFMVITVIANRRGLTDAAAVGIVEKIIGMMFLVPSSMMSAVSALAAQNIGANQPQRAARTMWYALGITFGIGVVIAIVTQLCAESIVGLFGKDAAVCQSGSQYLRSYVFDCALAGIHFCFSGYFCALGKAQISFIHNILSIVLARIPLSYLASLCFADTLYPMGLAAPIGSLLSVIICMIAYAWLKRQTKRLKI